MFHQTTEIFYSTHESTGWQRHMIPAQGTHSLEKQAGTRQQAAEALSVSISELWDMPFSGFCLGIHLVLHPLLSAS